MRIQGVEPDRAGPMLRWLYRLVRRKAGRVVAPVKIQAHHPRVLWATCAMELGQDGAKRVPKDLKTLAGILVAQRIGCPF